MTLRRSQRAFAVHEILLVTTSRGAAAASAAAASTTAARVRRTRQRAVTLIETLIAIALIAIVSGMGFVGMSALS